MSKRPTPSGSQALVPARSGALDAQLDRAVPGEAASAFLMVTKGDMLGRIFPLIHNTIVIGRGADCDIEIPDVSVSARHTRILNRPFGFDVEDLGSTNGTFVEDVPVTRSTLTSGQRLRVGGVELKLLMDRRNQPTMLLVPTLMPDGPFPQGRLTAARHHQSDDADESGPSLREVLGKAIRLYRVVQKHFVPAGIILGFSMLLAALSVLLLPPGSSAQCEVKLHPEARNNPVDPSAQNQPQTSTLFESPERSFINDGLVQTTLKALGNPSPATDEVNAVAGRLKLERISDNGFVASFTEGMLSRGRHDLVKLLTTHITTYVQHETNKALDVSVKESEFLRSQTQTAEKELSVIDNDLRRFKEENLSSLPESASLTLGSRAQMESRRPELTAQLARLSGEILGVKNQIASEGPLSAGRTQTSTAHRTRLAGINEKLAEQRARGLTSEHPDVQALAEEKRLTEELIEKELRSGPSELERKSSPELHALEAKLQGLRSLEAAARTELGELSGRIHVAKKLLDEMPRVDARLQDLLLKQEDQRKLYSQLFEQLKKAEVRLQLERVSVSSRHEMATQPQLVKPRKSKTAIVRFGLAIAFSFVLITAMVLVRELRPMLQAAWNEAEASSRNPGPKRS